MRLGRRLLFALLPMLGLVALAEGIARVYPPPAPATLARPDGGGIMLAGNPLLAWELSPGARLEDGHPVYVNHARFRDKERPAKGKKPRVLTLGDSTVYGFGVLDEEVFSSLLEKRLPADFIDGGVPGYSTEQALNLLAIRGFSLEPDVLIVATLWSDSNFDRFVDREILTRSNGVKLRWAASNLSALLGWAETYAVSQRQEQSRQVGWVTEDKAAGIRRVPIDDYATNLARFCELMAEREGGIVFVTLPGRDDVLDTMPSPEPWVPYRAVMKETAAAYGAPHVDLPAVFAAKADAGLMMDEVHPSVAGHVLIADTLEATLRDAGWPDTPLRVHPADHVAKVEDPFATQGDKYFAGMRGPLRKKGETPPNLQQREGKPGKGGPKARPGPGRAGPPDGDKPK